MWQTGDRLAWGLGPGLLPAGLGLVLREGPCWDHSGEKWRTGQVEGGAGSEGRPWAPRGDHPNSILLREAVGALPGTVQCSEVVWVPPSPSRSWRNARLQGQDGKECGGWAGLSNIVGLSPCSLCAARSPDLGPAVKVGRERITSFHGRVPARLGRGGRPASRPSGPVSLSLLLARGTEDQLLPPPPSGSL